MAIIYSVTKSKGIRTLSVSQNTDYVVHYVCGGKKTEAAKGSLVSGGSVDLPASKDGTYEVTLSAEGETDVTYSYTVYENLLKSIILDVETYLSSECVPSSCNDSYNICITKEAEQYFQYKDLYTKLLVFQALYFEEISEGLVTIFSNFLASVVNADRCSIQTYVNNILQQECIWGAAKDASQLYKELVGYYYYAIYLTEKNLAGGDAEELEYLEQIFNTTTIDNLINENTCIDPAATEDIYNEVVSAGNTKPTVDDFTIIPGNNLPDNLFQYTFSGAEFTNNFQDLQGDSPGNIRFGLLPVRGTLKYNGVAVTLGTEYPHANADLFTYEVTITDVLTVFDVIQFQISDDNSNPIYSDMAQVTINTSAYVNQPISQLGDLTLNKGNRENHVFTISDFTTSLVPPYVDPEGDSLDAIRVDSLPATGTLQLSGVNVQINDIIDAADINAGNFVYVAPNQDASASNNFNFSARDAGSLQWVS